MMILSKKTLNFEIKFYIFIWGVWASEELCVTGCGGVARSCGCPRSELWVTGCGGVARFCGCRRSELLV